MNACVHGHDRDRDHDHGDRDHGDRDHGDRDRGDRDHGFYYGNVLNNYDHLSDEHVPHENGNDQSN
jgi:hypothetical protein